MCLGQGWGLVTSLDIHRVKIYLIRWGWGKGWHQILFWIVEIQDMHGQRSEMGNQGRIWVGHGKNYRNWIDGKGCSGSPRYEQEGRARDVQQRLGAGWVNVCRYSQWWAQGDWSRGFMLHGDRYREQRSSSFPISFWVPAYLVLGTGGKVTRNAFREAFLQLSPQRSPIDGDWKVHLPSFFSLLW